MKAPSCIRCTSHVACTNPSPEQEQEQYEMCPYMEGQVSTGLQTVTMAMVSSITHAICCSVTQGPGVEICRSSSWKQISDAWMGKRTEWNPYEDRPKVSKQATSQIDPYSKMMKWKTNAICTLVVPSLRLVSGIFCIYVGCMILLEGKELSGGIC